MRAINRARKSVGVFVFTLAPEQAQKSTRSTGGFSFVSFTNVGQAGLARFIGSAVSRDAGFVIRSGGLGVFAAFRIGNRKHVGDARRIADFDFLAATRLGVTARAIINPASLWHGIDLESAREVGLADGPAQPPSEMGLRRREFPACA